MVTNGVDQNKVICHIKLTQMQYLLFQTKKRFILSHPVMSQEGKLEAVLELSREDKQFSEDDIQVFSIQEMYLMRPGFCVKVVGSYLVWSSMAIHYATVYHQVYRQKEVTDFLLSVVQ